MPMASSTRSPASTARSASSSCATGAPKMTSAPSPAMRSTWPPSASVARTALATPSPTIAWRSSGSSRSPSAVEPTTSANRAVTTFRASRWGASSASADPQPEQKRASSGFDRPQAWQTRESPMDRVYGREVLDAMREHGRPVTYETGERLLHEGDAGESVALILEGRVKVTHTDSDGRESVLDFRGAGELVGELSALDKGPRSSSVTAIEPVEALLVPVAEFRRLL